MLCNAEYQAEKTWLVQQMSNREQERYDKLHSEIGKIILTFWLHVCNPVPSGLFYFNTGHLGGTISDAQAKIEECKAELVRAKQIRRNKQGLC